MGAQHYHLEVVPIEFINLPSPVCRERIEEEKKWETQPSTKFLKSIRSLFPVDTSWGDTEEYESKKEWGSDLRIWHEDGLVDSIQLRYSFIDGPEVIKYFLSLVKEERRAVYSRQSKIVLPAAVERVEEYFQKSNAKLFQTNPMDSIQNAANAAEELIKNGS